MNAIRLRLWMTAALASLALTVPVQADPAKNSFFITSAGKGDGANPGGLEGAEAHCEALAKAAGSTKISWVLT